MKKECVKLVINQNKRVLVKISAFLIETLNPKAGLGRKTQQLAIKVKGIREFW
jgi:hypothetical protein